MDHADLNYMHGGINLRQFGMLQLAYSFLEDEIHNPIGWDHIRPQLFFTALGAALLGFFIYIQHIFYGGHCIVSAYRLAIVGLWEWHGFQCFGDG